jgi:hypothetical protein
VGVSLDSISLGGLEGVLTSLNGAVFVEDDTLASSAIFFSFFTGGVEGV